ncbi:hypothetical protein TWF730_006884 [Orbilia blumenaviensis]|uniref:Complex 1 LYR protein domain-containing protein n=1 Tax=Orbilia blumenaviensis TaxID=1796055 RepID=A0AAV9VLU8_9PEZI
MSTPVRIVPSLYRRALKTSLDWSVRRDIWRPQALAIRQLFEANKDVRAPKQLQVVSPPSPPIHPPKCPPTAYLVVLFLSTRWGSLF